MSVVRPSLRPSDTTRNAGPTARRSVERDLVLGCSAFLVLAQLGFRAWAIYPSWFLTDDYRLMRDARGEDFGWTYLTSPFDSQFMPVGRAVVWVVTHAGYTSWTLAATITLVAQLVASCACLAMLLTLFGARWGVLVPLSIYLTSAVTMPAFMWWAAALNQLPLQVCFFVAISCGTMYLRTHRWRWLALTALVVALGLACYVKAVLIVPVLAYLAVAHFAEGGALTRLRQVARRWWAAILLGGAMLVGYAVFYVTSIPQPFESGEDRASLAAETMGSMLGTSLPTGVLGGPWSWWKTSPPIVLVQPPSWSVHAAWVVITLVVLYCCLQRRRAVSAWLLLLGYALVLAALLATSRGQLFGRLAGLELRYLTDVVCVLTLAIGLAFMELRGAPSSSEPRAVPLLRWQAGPRLVTALTVVVCLGGVVSSVQYVGYWHHDNAGRAYVRGLQNELAHEAVPVDLPTQTVPDPVMPEYTKPTNSTVNFVPLLSGNARFPDHTDDLHVIDEFGKLAPAALDAYTASTTGPVPGCGWKVHRGPRTVPLTKQTYDWVWWLRIGYLASSDSTLTVTAGATDLDVTVRRGLNTVWVQAPGVFRSVALELPGDDVTVCVDSIEVGDPVPAPQP